MTRLIAIIMEIYRTYMDNRRKKKSVWKRNRRILYIAGPYRADTINEIYDNIAEARKRMIWAWRNGWIPICPHTNSALIDGIIPDKSILQGYKEIVPLCDAILLGSWGIGWHKSVGSIEEYTVALNYDLLIMWDPLGSPDIDEELITIKNLGYAPTHNAQGHERK